MTSTQGVLSQHSQPQTQPTLRLSLKSFAPEGSADTRQENSSKNTLCGWLVDPTNVQRSLPIHLGTTVTLGRHSNCDLSLDGDAVSNYHCRLVTTKEGVVFCEDLSTNGTYWNGHLVGKSESVVLSHGDSIRFRISYSFIYQDFSTIKPTQNDPEIAEVEKMYQILPRTLGQGTFAKVQVAIHRRTKVQLAVKIMDRIRFGAPGISGGTDIEKEVAILQSVNHPNIVPIVDVIKTRKFVYILLQMLTGGDLFDYVVKAGPLPDVEAKFVAYQILRALQYLHERNISHRDLKPENLLLTSSGKFPRIMLADFGMAREQKHNRLMSTMCGTFAYMAPEVFDIKYAKRPGYGHTADCWSLGVSLYVLLSGAHPFTDEVLQFPVRFWKGSSADARSLVRGLLATNPEDRFTVNDALASDWISHDLRWLEQKYEEVVMRHWDKHSRVMDGIRRSAQLKRECDARLSDTDRPSKRAVLESHSANSWSTSSRVPSVSDYETSL